ncbi:MAG: hypothetical protein V3T59_02870 [Desulfobacterales bacterium]
MSPERSEVEFFNFSAASRRTLQFVPTISSEVQTLVNRNIFMTTGIMYSINFINKKSEAIPPIRNPQSAI